MAQFPHTFALSADQSEASATTMASSQGFWTKANATPLQCNCINEASDTGADQQIDKNFQCIRSFHRSLDKS
jgi:hypothetical protein